MENMIFFSVFLMFQWLHSSHCEVMVLVLSYCKGRDELKLNFSELLDNVILNHIILINVAMEGLGNLSVVGEKTENVFQF